MERGMLWERRESEIVRQGREGNGERQGKRDTGRGDRERVIEELTDLLFFS
jgi:hypothetical protein